MSAFDEPLWWGPIALVIVASFLFFGEGRLTMSHLAHELAQFAIFLFVSALTAVWYRAYLTSGYRAAFQARKKELQKLQQSQELLLPEQLEQREQSLARVREF